MNDPKEIAEFLHGNLNLYRDILHIVESERQELREMVGKPLVRQYAAKKDLLPILVRSLDPLASSRATWQGLSPSQRAHYPEVGALVRENQDVLMKIIVLDRENEQTLLRQGRLATRDLPSVNCQRPNFVAELYRRQGIR